MRIPNITGFYPAHTSNYTKGRSKPIRVFTVHHSAGWEQTLRYLWADPNRNASSTLYVSASVREQYVDTNDTPWTNGNFASNSEAITVEVRGDWRNGYRDQATLNNLTEVMYQCLKIWPHLVLNYHMDVTTTSTLCPADLKLKSYALACWNSAKARIANESKPPTPAPSKITYQKITPKRVQLIRAANLWDFNFTSWDKAKAVQAYPSGHIVDVVAVATNQLGGKYYMTAYSYNNGSIRATNGFNMADVKDYAPVITQPPTVEPKWEPMDKPRKLKAAQDLYVINLDTMKNEGAVITKGTEIDFKEKKTLKDNRMYLRSKWATDNNKNWGIPMDVLAEIDPETPREPIPEPPINVDPDTPTDSDKVVDKNVVITFLEMIVKLITDFIAGLRK